LWQVEALTDSCYQTPNKFTDTPLVKNNSGTTVAFVTPQDEHGVLGKSAQPCTTLLNSEECALSEKKKKKKSATPLRRI